MNSSLYLQLRPYFLRCLRPSYKQALSSSNLNLRFKFDYRLWFKFNDRFFLLIQLISIAYDIYVISKKSCEFFQLINVYFFEVAINNKSNWKFKAARTLSNFLFFSSRLLCCAVAFQSFSSLVTVILSIHFTLYFSYYCFSFLHEKTSMFIRFYISFLIVSFKMITFTFLCHIQLCDRINIKPKLIRWPNSTKKIKIRLN